MPKYRFSTDDGDSLDINDEHREFPSDKAASNEAQRYLADLARENLPDGKRRDMRVIVENEAGEVVYQASLDFRGETAAEMRATAQKIASRGRESMN